MEIQFLQILFQIINFSVVLGALTYLLYKPILKILDERARRIEEGQQAAQQNLTERAELEAIKKQTRKQAEKEAAEILEQAKKEADKRGAELSEKAQEHAKAQVLKFQAEWQEQKKELANQLKEQFAEAVIAAASKVVAASLDKKAQTKIIDDELTALLKSI